MNKKLSKLISLVIVCLLVFASVGCGSTSKAKTGIDALTTTGLPIVKDKITIKVLAAPTATANISNDQPFYQELTKRTNVAFDFQLLPVQDTKTKFNLVMASGTLPDVVTWGYKDDTVKYGKDGAFIPLETLIEKYAPNIKSVLNNPPIDKLPFKQNILGDITADDGHIYSLPMINPSNAIGPVFAIRTDWLKRLNLKAPTTTEELYNVLKAFKEQDANGNGKPDEVPFAADGGRWTCLLPLVNSFGGHMDLYLDKSSDNIKFGPTEDKYGKGLEYINKLFQGKLVDEEYISITRDKWLSKIANNQVGMIYTWAGSGLGAANAAVQKLNPDYKYEAIVPFKGPDGTMFKDTSMSGSLAALRMSFTKDNKNAIATIKMIDYLWSKEGETLVNYGIEGKHYTMVNGKPQYTDYVLNNTNGKDPEQVKLNDGLKTIVFPWWNTWDPEMETMQKKAPWTVDAWNKYREPGIIEAPLPNLTINDQAIIRKLGDIRTKRDEQANSFIMGKTPITDFSKFTKTLNDMGISDVLRTYNDAYKTYKEKAPKLK